MGGRARWMRIAFGTSVVSVVLALAGCGAAALPPPPPAAPSAVVVPTAKATSVASAPTKTSATPSGNTALLAAGKAAFSASGCAACHMLTASGSAGGVGPSLNGIGSVHDAPWIVLQMQNPCAPGHANAGGSKYNCAAMPANLASGTQAQAIAAYLAAQK